MNFFLTDSGQFFGSAFEHKASSLNAKLNLRFRFSKVLNLEPEHCVQFISVQVQTNFRTEHYRYLQCLHFEVGLGGQAV
jgi:hypothetical protein